MQVLRTIKREWETIGATGVFFALLVYGVYQLYCAWTFGAVRSGLGWSSYGAEPVLFIVVLTLVVIGTMVSAVLVIGSIFGWRAEQRFFQRRASQPSVDHSIRDQFDRR